MKIALITDDFPPFSIGGIAAYSYDLAYALSKRKIETTVFCGRGGEYRIDHPNPYLTIIHLPYLQIPPKYLWFQTLNFATFLRTLRKFDLVHAASSQSFGLVSNFKSLLGRPLVTTIHGDGGLSNLKVFADSPISTWTGGDLLTHGVAFPINEALTEWSLMHSDHLFVCGSNTFRGLREMHRIRCGVSIVRNGIDFGGLPKFSDVQEDVNLILYFGRLEWNKGLLYLVRAVSLLTGEFPRLRLEICGTGPLAEQVKQLVHSLGLEEHVFLNGFVMHDELLNKIRKSRLVVLPSLIEAQPIAPLEAMALGKVVVAFDYPFAHEYIINSQTGLLAKPKDSEDLAAKIRVLLSNSKERTKLGRSARRYTETNHNWETLVNEYLPVYERLT